MGQQKRFKSASHTSVKAFKVLGGIDSLYYFADTTNDDVIIMKSIREITGRGNNAEVKRRSDGRLAVYEVKKSITIG